MTKKELFQELAGSTDLILNNLTIGVQKENAESPKDMVIHSTPFDGIIAYLMLSHGNANIRHGIRIILKNADISEGVAWSAAMENVKKNVRIKGITEVLTGEQNPMEELFVISTKKMYGASAVLDADAMRNFAHMHHTHKIVVLPSSIHEMLLVPHPERMGINIDEFSKLVSEINGSKVEPEDRLTDRAYIVNI